MKNAHKLSLNRKISFRNPLIFWPPLLTLVLLLTCVAPAQTFSVLYNFRTRGLGQPQFPGTLAQGRDGNIYGTTPTGGTYGYGSVYKISPAGGHQLLYSFTGSEGASPFSGLTLGHNGEFYGTTAFGGTHDCGTLFKINASGTFEAVYDFSGGDGCSPTASPIQGSDGYLYGGAGGGNGWGTLYKMTHRGALIWSYLMDANAYGPSAPLFQATNNNLYGTGYSGSGYGAVFNITPGGRFRIFHTFNLIEGAVPDAGLIQASDGNFYGTTFTGGVYKRGVIFKIIPPDFFIVLRNFSGPDGSNPLAGLVEATDGKFYGVTRQGGKSGAGVIYSIDPDGRFHVVYNFDGVTAGTPKVTLIQHTNGLLYGETSRGGTYRAGTFYSFDVGLKPFVRLLPEAGRVGKSIGILGQGFKGTSAVSFNGTAANFKVVSGTYLTASVPSGATTGPVTVTTPGGPLNSNRKFRVTPQISGFDPTSGPVGTPVTITGVSLTQTSKVTIGGVQAADYTVDSDNRITATVPPGAKTGKIAVVTAGGKAISTGSFTVTP